MFTVRDPALRVLVRRRPGWRHALAGALIALARRLEGGVYAELTVRLGPTVLLDGDTLARCLLHGARHTLALIRAEHLCELTDVALRASAPELFGEGPGA